MINSIDKTHPKKNTDAVIQIVKHLSEQLSLVHKF